MELNIMVDLETLGLKQNAKILSIGATCLEFGMSFYLELAPDWQYGRSTDESTLAWWESQGNMPKGTASIKDAVVGFTNYLEMCHTLADPSAEFYIWCRGTDFDIPKLYSMFEGECLVPPWKYNNVRDLRTLAAAFPHIEAPKDPAKHHALADAIFQAQHLKLLMQELKKG